MQPLLLLSPSVSLLKFYLEKKLNIKNFKILDAKEENFLNFFLVQKNKNLFDKTEQVLVIKNFFSSKNIPEIKSFFVIWEEKLPKNEVFNFYQRKFQFQIIDLKNFSKDFLEEIIKTNKIQISEELKKEFLEIFLQDDDGFEALLKEIEKLSLYSQKIDSRVINDLFYPPFWIKNSPIWEDIENSLVGAFFRKSKSDFLKKMKKNLRQGIKFEMLLGEFNFVLKTLIFKKFFGLPINRFEEFNKKWSYQELKKLTNFLAQADIKFKKFTSPKEILESLLFNFLN